MFFLIVWRVKNNFVSRHIDQIIELFCLPKMNIYEDVNEGYIVKKIQLSFQMKINSIKFSNLSTQIFILFWFVVVYPVSIINIYKEMSLLLQ